MLRNDITPHHHDKTPHTLSRTNSSCSTKMPPKSKSKASIIAEPNRRTQRSSVVDKPPVTYSRESSPLPEAPNISVESPNGNGNGNGVAKQQQKSPTPQRQSRSRTSTPQAEEPAPAKRARRTSRKFSVERDSSEEVEMGDPLEYIQKAATQEDLESWKGWCELESEPAFFNVMLRDLGVEGVKVQEVFSLEHEMLEMIPKPIHGLIFLFQFQDDDPIAQEEECPPHIWFANQTTDNACATIALLNIIMNASSCTSGLGIDIGPTLQSLKDFSKVMTPALRGYTVGNHDFIRTVHNSFTRKMDMINADLHMSNAITAKAAKRSKTTYKSDDFESEAGYHFVAFVPIGGDLWKLDGLERQPMNLGECTDHNWLELATPLIQERMYKYEENAVNFNLLAACESPLKMLKTELCDNIHTLESIEEALDKQQPDWQKFICENQKHRLIVGPDASYSISQCDFDEACADSDIVREIQEGITNERLMELQKQHSGRQRQVKMSLLDEINEIRQDDEAAASRRHDMTPFINSWIAALAEKGMLRELAEKYPADEEAEF